MSRRLVSQPAQKQLSRTISKRMRIKVPGGRISFRRFSAEQGTGTPLVVVHGGPGVPHDYLEPLAELVRERPVIFYDQLGCGDSDEVNNTSLLHIDRFVVELRELFCALQLRTAHILGHSWGAAVALEHTLVNAPSVASLILADPFHSGRLWIRDSQILRNQLPANVKATLARHEAAGTIESDEYEEATMVFYRRHLNRQDPWPEVLENSYERMSPFVYRTMWGPNEFTLVGTLAKLDQTDRMREVRVPTLLVCGRHDEARPETVDYYGSLIPNSQVHVFEQSSHTPHLEEPQKFLRVVTRFLWADRLLNGGGGDRAAY